jgi:ferritin
MAVGEAASAAYNRDDSSRLNQPGEHDMLKANVVNALNAQIKQELTAAQGYLAVSVYFARETFDGLAAYMLKQSGEERDHAMRILKYLQDVNATVTLTGLDGPKTEFASPLEALKQVREMERANTASINALYVLAQKEGDLATQNMLQWFINEQVEEEKWAEDFVAIGEKIGGQHPGAWYMFDHRVSKLAGKE